MTTNPDFDQIWQRIVAVAGQQFKTASGLLFTFDVKGNVLRPSRTKYNLPRSDFEKASQLLPFTTRSKLNRAIRGPSYVIAILSDPRVQGSA
jgi:hypothetical protein